MHIFVESEMSMIDNHILESVRRINGMKLASLIEYSISRMRGIKKQIIYV